MSIAPGTTTLLSEANHRIANSMAAIAGLVRLQASDERRVAQLRSPAEVRTFLAEVGSRIDAAAQLHRLLAMSDDGAAIEVAGFVRNVARSTHGANGLNSVANLAFEGRSDCLIAADKALSIGLIVVELVTNALKYAHPAGVEGQILVSVDQEDGHVIVAVADDGVGLPETMDWTSETSLGFRLIRSLTRQLGGEFSVDSNDMGVVGVLRVPCPPTVRERLHVVEAEPA